VILYPTNWYARTFTTSGERIAIVVLWATALSSAIAARLYYLWSKKRAAKKK
jgi:hypothetical protein